MVQRDTGRPNGPPVPLSAVTADGCRVTGDTNGRQLTGDTDGPTWRPVGSGCVARAWAVHDGKDFGRCGRNELVYVWITR